MKVIEFTDVTVRRGQNILLEDLNWQVELGQNWVVLGPNGAGKTTLVQLIAGRIYPSSGTVQVVEEQLGQVDLQDLRPLVGVASPALDNRFDEDSSAISVVLSSAYGYLRRGRENYEPEDYERAEFLLEKFGVKDIAQRRYGTLSTGEKKRVQIARALMSDPEILVLDEPAAGIDLHGREELLADLTRLAHDPMAPVMVIVTHHVEEIPAGFTHLMLLANGQLQASGTLIDTLNEENLSSTFGIPLEIRAQGHRWTAYLAN